MRPRPPPQVGGHEAVPRSNGIGQPVLRKEDVRLVTGAGRYSDDLSFSNEVHAFVLRSTYAHARIISIDTKAARAAPGVVRVLTGIEVEADGLQPIPPDFLFVGTEEFQRSLPDPILRNRDGSAIFASPYPLLPRDCVRYVGQAVAMVVAETVAAAKDAAELIDITYEPLPVVTDTAAAADRDAPRLWEHAASNVCIDAEIGDREATEAAFARATHVVSLRTWIQRVTGVPMETRSAIGVYDATTERYMLYAGSGGVVRQKREIAGILNVPFESVRVVAFDIGGNFGTKNSLFPEFPLLVWAARKVGRPVKWTCERTEAFLSDYQGRDLVSDTELALDGEGTFLALRGSNLSNIGAYAASIVPLRKGVGIISGLYRIPAAHFRARAVLSNTPPTIPYRSAGRPEAIYVIERLIDIAADLHGFDPIELRRKNLIRPDELPYRNPTGVTYDNGEYARVMDHALRLAEWSTFAERRAQAKHRGKLRGIGLANYIELTMGNPRERAEVIVRGDGNVHVIVGTLSSGQGHETSFTQCVSEWMGVPFERVHLVQGDTDIVPVGGGSHSGRSMRFAGIVMGKATEKVIERGREMARHVLKAGNKPVVYEQGRFRVAEAGLEIDIFALARATECENVPEHLRGPLSAEHDEVFKLGGFPYGCHICEVEIDPETGATDIVRYAAVDDVGRAINPMIVEGQTHGGIAQGVGQALWENCVYHTGSGQLLSASFMDYAMPIARNLPSFVTAISEVRSPGNPLGVRAGGEGGTTPALAVVINAIVDALSELGIRHVEMPATPERIWRAIQVAQGYQVKQ
ncbi:MAG: xanthine dehydrogenase family protein molybdopterin-binding subunit [Bradyrhizobiaceae bacterium]|nr:xanthine dehydrogenase family protein molybdopterin-binding subunit [Bradyrhizobiaceae bacterium]